MQIIANPATSTRACGQRGSKILSDYGGVIGQTPYDLRKTRALASCGFERLLLAVRLAANPR